MKITLSGPKTNWFNTRLWVIKYATLMGFADDYQRVEEIEDRLDNTFVGRRMKSLSRWWNGIWGIWDGKPKIRIDPHDVWGMDATLSYIIHDMLVVLKDQLHGAPNVDKTDIPEHLHPEDKYFERWDWVLDEMIWAFKNASIDVLDVPGCYTGELDIQWKPCGEGLSQVAYGPNHTWKPNKQKIAEFNARRKNGLRLFAKYYFCLWD